MSDNKNIIDFAKKLKSAKSNDNGTITDEEILVEVLEKGIDMFNEQMEQGVESFVTIVFTGDSTKGPKVTIAGDVNLYDLVGELEKIQMNLSHQQFIEDFMLSMGMTNELDEVLTNILEPPPKDTE